LGKTQLPHHRGRNIRTPDMCGTGHSRTGRPQ
jgi:hypothetical protein